MNANTIRNSGAFSATPTPVNGQSPHRTAQGQADEHPMVRLARRVADTMYDQFRLLLGEVAHDGDTELVRALYEAGLLNGSRAKLAVLPLPQYAKDREAALALIRRVLSVKGCLAADTVADYFADADSPDVVRTLGELDGDPNHWANENSSRLETPLSTQIDSVAQKDFLSADSLEPALAILELMKERGVVPLDHEDLYDQGATERVDFFQAVARCAVDGDSKIGDIYLALMLHIEHWEWPDAWRRAAGEAVLQVAAEKRSMDGDWQTKLMAGLLAMARFEDAKTWAGLFDITSRSEGLVRQVGYWISDNAICGGRGLRIAKNMISHGAAIDDIKVDVHRDFTRARGTMLHGAIMQKNAQMVEILLEGGASPWAITSVHPAQPKNPDVGLCAVDLAQKYHLDALPLLHAWKAKDAITRVRAGVHNHAPV